jgi:hypothetical protein
MEWSAASGAAGAKLPGRQSQMKRKGDAVSAREREPPI